MFGCTRFNSFLSSKFCVFGLFGSRKWEHDYQTSGSRLSRSYWSKLVAPHCLFVNIYLQTNDQQKIETRTWISNHCRCPAHGLNGWCWNDHIIKIDWHDVWMVHVSWSPQSEACLFFSTCLQIHNDLSVHMTQGEALEVDFKTLGSESRGGRVDWLG